LISLPNNFLNSQTVIVLAVWNDILNFMPEIFANRRERGPFVEDHDK
jgi:hypothetical protein